MVVNELGSHNTSRESSTLQQMLPDPVDVVRKSVGLAVWISTWSLLQALRLAARGMEMEMEMEMENRK